MWEVNKQQMEYDAQKERPTGTDGTGVHTTEKATEITKKRKNLRRES